MIDKLNAWQKKVDDTRMCDNDGTDDEAGDRRGVRAESEASRMPVARATRKHAGTIAAGALRAPEYHRSHRESAGDPTLDEAAAFSGAAGGASSGPRAAAVGTARPLLTQKQRHRA
jgi:hypothetical protein